MSATSDIRRRADRLKDSARYGRARARLPRYAFLAVVVVLCVTGVRSILSPPSAPSFAAEGTGAVDFAAQSFATDFARAYLSYDAAHPQAHEASLRRFTPAGLEQGAGFTPPTTGSQRVEWAEVAQVQHPISGGLAITVAAKLREASEPLYLSVPVGRGNGGAIFLGGYPSFVGAPLTSTQESIGGAGETVSDGEISRLVSRALSNYLAGDGENLAADLAQAATVTLPSNRLTFAGLDELSWVDASHSGAVLATVRARDERGGLYALRYEVGVRRVIGADPRIAPAWRIAYVQAISQEP